MIKDIVQLWRHLSLRRKRQLVGLLGLMLVGAVAELLTLGAVVPFLALMADPQRALEFPLIGDLAKWFGWTSEDLLIPAALLFVAIAIVSAAIRLLLEWANNKFVFGVGHDLGVQVYENVLYQPYSWHMQRNSSESLAVINKVQMLVTGSIMPLMKSLVAATTTVFILAGLLAIDAMAALVAGGGFASLYGVVSVATRRRIRANGGVIASAQGSRIRAMQEGLGAIRDVIIDNVQSVYRRRFQGEDARLRVAQATNAFLGQAPRYVLESSAVVLVVLLAVVMAGKPGGIGAALPVLGALALGGQKLMPLLQILYASWTRFLGNHAVLKDVNQLLQLPGRGALPHTKPLRFQRAIRFEDVNFRYSEQSPEVLQVITFEIEKGSRVGFIGATGSGKSTTLDLLMGLLEPTSGQIWVDDSVLDESTRSAWQAHIAHVPQAIYLSDVSLRENIAFGIEPSKIDAERVRSAARRAQLHDFIESLSQGYDTLVGENGVRLSGGQRQRIGIARALYKNADVLVLDEATSALDDATETAVVECIDQLSRDLTVLVIAHRTTTLRNCDQVIELQAGQVKQVGSYAEVVDRESASLLPSNHRIQNAG
ncbi:ABC transporter ATP-binding protein [Algiphilus sp. NNCM1]|uniref:ABC transporter ATP-binding protein n=1 Tax=Algiphilus sp. TaxID=1872431 RepID=UPI001CA74AD0|nr:ABC transporter ATP-binding protein [Algiphilus sp.]MBY8965029.1 ABC transporter ATP-binding protein [Algiphilus acroporae]MCI5104185.1 ABC transporter ATP-binding protein/permease [Algiphilus sp.]